MATGILGIVGGDKIGIMSPVSICMFLVVLLVRVISPHGLDDSPIQAAVTLYLEKSSDSIAQKFEGALMNSLALVLLIAVLTFLLVLLYYYRCKRYLKCHMYISTFLVLACVGGAISVLIIQAWSIPVDVISFSIFLFNFAVVGVLSTFAAWTPIVIKQFYAVIKCVFLAYLCTILPEWTTWALLVALAVYDLVSVLAPGGPLNLLGDLVTSTGEEVPSMYYESRPTVYELQSQNFPIPFTSEELQSQNFPIPFTSEESKSLTRLSEITNLEYGKTSTQENSNPTDINQTVGSDSPGEEFEMDDVRAEVREQRVAILISPGIELGLGDFVVYGVLVGRAAMYDLMTVYACYVAIIFGLACTRGLADVYQRDLPALPISISLGVVFYFVTRLLIEPFVMGLSTKLLMF